MASTFVMVVVAVLVAGVSYAALQEYRAGRNVACERRAFDAAEAGLARGLERLETAGLDSLAVGDSMGFTGFLPGRSASYSGAVLRLNPWLLLVRSTGHDGGGSAERALAVLARLAPLPVLVPAALVATGAVEVGPSGSVDGTGADPEGWSCPAPQDPVPGVLIGDTTLLRVTACVASDCVRGNPGVREDTSLRGSAVPLLGEAVWTSLLQLADTIPSAPAPLGDAVGSFPIRYAPGDLVLNGVAARGVLLVQGDLALEGGAEFAGLVVTRGHLSIRGAGGRVLGAAVAAGADLGTASGGGPAAVVYSGCVVRRVEAATARARPLEERPWATVF
jgi:hypothetical protein